MTEKKTAEEGYKLIPMSEITDEAREIAVRWMECDDKDWIGQKHKLASDIMNYAKKYAAQQSKMDYSEVGVYDIANKWAAYLPLGHIIEGRDAMVNDIYGLLNAHAETIAQKMIKEQSKMPTDIEIQSYLETTRREDGSPSMDEQTFYEGAKWLRTQIEKR